VPTQVAVRATAAVAAIYLMLSVVVVFIVNHNLTAGVDQHVASGLASMQQFGKPYSGQISGPGGIGDPSGHRGGGPLTFWVIGPDGRVLPPPNGTNTYAELPTADRHVAGPRNVSASGLELRVQGGPIVLVSRIDSSQVNGWVVVGQ